MVCLIFGFNNDTSGARSWLYSLCTIGINKVVRKEVRNVIFLQFPVLNQVAIIEWIITVNLNSDIIEINGVTTKILVRQVESEGIETSLSFWSTPTWTCNNIDFARIKLLPFLC